MVIIWILINILKLISTITIVIVEIIILSLDKYDIFLEKNMSYTELISNVEDFCTEMQKIDSEQVKVERSDSDLFYYETFYEILLEHGIHIKVLMQEEKIPYFSISKKCFANNFCYYIRNT